jgi:N-acetylglucosamine-6-phosphate deacetylase
MGVGIVDAAICASTPARAMGLQGLGTIATGAVADLVVLDRALNVVNTFITGKLVHSRV